MTDIMYREQITPLNSIQTHRRQTLLTHYVVLINYTHIHTLFTIQLN